MVSALKMALKAYGFPVANHMYVQRFNGWNGISEGERRKLRQGLDGLECFG